MLIDPTQLTDYAYNGIVERVVGHLLSDESGLPDHDYCFGEAREGYDFRIGQIPVELKITNNVYLPVEVSKDLEGKVPSGVAVSIAPYILYLSHGHGPKSEGSQPCVKVRLLPRKWLLKEAKKSPPSVYTNGKQTEHATVHYIKQDFLKDDIWLGDMQFKLDETTGRYLYDTSTFVPSAKAGAMLRWLNQGYIDGDIT